MRKTKRGVEIKGVNCQVKKEDKKYSREFRNKKKTTTSL
jgi:hypothetical protein